MISAVIFICALAQSHDECRASPYAQIEQELSLTACAGMGAQGQLPGLVDGRSYVIVQCGAVR
jgi:hypothetical protein